MRNQCKIKSEAFTDLGKNKVDPNGSQNKPNVPKSRLGAFRIQSLSTISFLSGYSTLVGFTLARLPNAQENLEGNLESRKTFEIALVSLTNVRLASVQENRGGRLDAARPAVNALRFIFWSEIS